MERARETRPAFVQVAFQQLTRTELAAPVSGRVGQVHYKALCGLNWNADGSREAGKLSERTR